MELNTNRVGGGVRRARRSWNFLSFGPTYPAVPPWLDGGAVFAAAVLPFSCAECCCVSVFLFVPLFNVAKRE